MSTLLRRLARRPRTLAALLAVSLAGTVARAQIAPVDTKDPIAVEELNATMEDAFEDSPFSMDPATMMSGEGMFGAFFGPSVTKADFARFLKILGLTKEQSEAATIIYRQRLENYEAKGKPMQEMITSIMKKAMESMAKHEQFEPENMDEITKAAHDIQKERATMTKGVLEDLKALLTTEQEPLWPKVEAAERRNRLMRFQPIQMVPGVQVDFHELLETAFTKPGASRPDAGVMASIESSLATYDLALDEQAHLAVPLDDTMRSEMLVDKPSPEQMERQMKIMGEGMVIGEKVQNATQAACKAIAATLGGSSPATRDAFLESYNAAAFPNIYRQTHGEMVTDAALKLPDLTEDQRKGVTAIKDEIGAKYKDLRPKAVQEAIDMQKFQSAMMAAKDDEARQKVMEKMQGSMSMMSRYTMKAADKEAVKKIRALLTEAQREKLPKRPRPLNPFALPAPEPAAEPTDK